MARPRSWILLALGVGWLYLRWREVTALEHLAQPPRPPLTEDQIQVLLTQAARDYFNGDNGISVQYEK